MSNPTTPFNWQMPTNTDLVTDLPADFEVFGQAVATSMADLLGGTTGQILAKNSNTDMDFVWIANDQGDITGITATSPLTGGGTSGAITVGIQSASTTQSGAVQLSDSTSTTSSVLASTPTATKSAYDLATTANTAAGTAQTTANAAIPKSTVTTSGDVIYATGSSAVTRLGIGSTGQVLTVASGLPSWATPASSGGLTLVTAQTFSASSAISFNNCFTSTYQNYRILVTGKTSTNTTLQMRIRKSGTDNSSSSYETRILGATTPTTSWNLFSSGSASATAFGFDFLFYEPLSTGYPHITFDGIGLATGVNGQGAAGGGYFDGSISGGYDGFSIILGAGTFTGSIRIYGYSN
jgi:hypothetical protein